MSGVLGGGSIGRGGTTVAHSTLESAYQGINDLSQLSYTYLCLHGIPSIPAHMFHYQLPEINNGYHYRGKVKQGIWVKQTSIDLAIAHTY